MHHKILYTSDNHANEELDQKLIKYALQIKPDSIIIGGDIAPKEFSIGSFVLNQREFLKKTLPVYFNYLVAELPGVKTYLMLGNDDSIANLDVLENADPRLYQNIHGRRLPLVDGFEIVGYSHVPLTHITLKDWERFDLSEIPPQYQEMDDARTRTGIRLRGWQHQRTGRGRFRKNAVRKVEFTEESRTRDSIQKDLSGDLYRQNPKKTIFVSHAPPYGTDLDVAHEGHVGSIAVLSFIQEVQPHISLHGHIHKTVDRTGNYKQMIGETLSMTAGNSDKKKELAVLVFDLYNPEGVERIIL